MKSWIKCIEEAPDIEIHVLLFDMREGICVGYRSALADCYNHYPMGDFATGCALFHVTHWMPLPDAPK